MDIDLVLGVCVVSGVKGLGLGMLRKPLYDEKFTVRGRRGLRRGRGAAVDTKNQYFEKKRVKPYLRDQKKRRLFYTAERQYK